VSREFLRFLFKIQPLNSQKSLLNDEISVAILWTGDKVVRRTIIWHFIESGSQTPRQNAAGIGNDFDETP
jgi:hypothetical protein